jgi:hypothetical protein
LAHAKSCIHPKPGKAKKNQHADPVRCRCEAIALKAAIFFWFVFFSKKKMNTSIEKNQKLVCSKQAPKEKQAPKSLFTQKQVL